MKPTVQGRLFCFHEGVFGRPEPCLQAQGEGQEVRVIFDIGHPAQVHLFRNAIRQLQGEGHQVAITCSDKDVAIRLLEGYGIPYRVIGRSRRGLVRLAFEMLARDARLLRFARSFKPDILVGGPGNVTAPAVARLLRKPSVVFDDTEHSRYEHFLMDRLATIICTPASYKKRLGRMQVRYEGYPPLAYLHPRYFKPDPSVLPALGLAPGERVVVMRFVAFHASHDSATSGFSLAAKRRMVESFRKYGRVIITSESPLPEDLGQYQLKLSPEQLHSVLFYSDLYVGDGGTTAVEAALLGTPAVHCVRVARGDSVLSAADIHGTFWDLQNRYGLLFSYTDEDQAVRKAGELLGMTDAKKIWRDRLDSLLASSTDVTSFMAWIIPGSCSGIENIRGRMPVHGGLTDAY